MQLMDDLDTPIITTNWVLVELGNFLAGTPGRQLFMPFVRELRDDSRFVLLRSPDSLVDEGMDMYGRRKDKEWSMTDCISFVVMRQHDLSKALTSDRHFEQAGFEALLR
jgi:uncharacterized protein